MNYPRHHLASSTEMFRIKSLFSKHQVDLINRGITVLTCIRIMMTLPISDIGQCLLSAFQG